MASLKSSYGKTIVITCDGLTNVNHKSVFNIMVCTPLPLFFDSFQLDGQEESADKLFIKIKTAKTQIEEELSHRS
ncbi:MAG TPA: hypothetical protein VER35_03130, partial [Candidatus Limnocylindrales bacterium]|nr:hypothetical protein [Candidatus Limnocylindrales bacterium]